MANTRDIITNLVGTAHAALRHTPEDGGDFQGGQGHGQDLIENTRRTFRRASHDGDRARARRGRGSASAQGRPRQHKFATVSMIQAQDRPQAVRLIYFVNPRHWKSPVLALDIKLI